MSCMIAHLPGGSPEIFPIPIDAMEQLREAGLEATYGLGLKKKDTRKGYEHIGAAKRTDGTPFYLWISAPNLEIGQTKPWVGAFFAPFGIGNVVGLVLGDPGIESRDQYAITKLSVKAELQVCGERRVAASWAVVGSQLTVPNKSAMIESVEVTDAGPHHLDDIRRCIALHAPQRALGEPRAIVSMQCGVAAACLIEAIC